MGSKRERQPTFRRWADTHSATRTRVCGLVVCLGVGTLTLHGCDNSDSEWRGCEVSRDCNWDERCEINIAARVGICVDSGDIPQLDAGVISNGRCSSGVEEAGSRVEVVPSTFGGAAFSFHLSQQRYTEPQPCDNDLKLTLSISNHLATTESFQYRISTTDTNGNSYGTSQSVVVGLPPGSSTDQGVVLESNVNIQHLRFFIEATPL